MAPLLLLTVLFLISLSLLLWRKNHHRNRQHHLLPPGPPRIPIIGNLHQLGKQPERAFTRLAQKYGPLMYLELGAVPVIIASSAQAAKELLKTHDLDCCNRPVQTSTTKLTFGNNDIIFRPYGEPWRELRKTFTIEFLSMRKLQKLLFIREEEVDRMIDTISECSRNSTDNNAVNLSAEAVVLATDITCRETFGRRYCNRGTAERRELLGMIKEFQAVIGHFYFSDFVPALGFLDRLTGNYNHLEKVAGDFGAFYQKVIDEHLDTYAARMNSGVEEDSLDALLRARSELSSTLTVEHIKGLLQDVLIGGSDTTSSILEWAMTELMRNPEAMRKGQDELRSVIGSKGKVEEKDIPQLPYLKCILKESMRFHPPAPLIGPRETIRQFTVDGFTIPAGTRVLINVGAIGKDARSWENPEEFNPDRFIGSSIDVRGNHFELIPFGAGRRVCPGMNSGLAVVELALANLLYSFDWELPEGMRKEDIDMDETPGLAVHRRTPLRLVATKHNHVG